MLILGCSQKVVSFVNEEATFKALKTYRIVNYKVNKGEIPKDGKIIYDQIEEGIMQEMNRRQYQQSNIEYDILIRYEIISNQVSDVSSTQASPFYYSPIVTVRTILQSAILVEMTDVKNDKLIWQASVDMSQYDNNKKQSEIIQKAITTLYDTYLYEAGKSFPNESLKSEK